MAEALFRGILREYSRGTRGSGPWNKTLGSSGFFVAATVNLDTDLQKVGPSRDQNRRASYRPQVVGLHTDPKQ